MASPSSSSSSPPPQPDQKEAQLPQPLSPPPPPPLPPPSNPNSTELPTPDSPATKKTQPLPWTHEETINLIQAYQEKWYSLKKGQLKSSQWEEVAITVAARCAYDEPSKSATQCRHKIEKLRKRYRAERLKPRPNYWQYFDLMDRMERGPLPISVARPIHMVQYHQSNQPNSSSESDIDYNSKPNLDTKRNKSKSINHLVRGINSINTDSVLRVSRNPIVRKREDFFESDNDDHEEEEEVEGTEMVAELALEIRAFAERFVKMENKKIEMMRETERYKMEMENKRMEMILGSQQKLVDTIHKAFSSSRTGLHYDGATWSRTPISFSTKLFLFAGHMS